MTLAQQMRVEFVDIGACLGAYVALPWIRFTVAALVQEVERLIGELDSAIGTEQISLFRIRSEDDCIIISAG